MAWNQRKPALTTLNLKVQYWKNYCVTPPPFPSIIKSEWTSFYHLPIYPSPTTFPTFHVTYLHLWVSLICKNTSFNTTNTYFKSSIDTQVHSHCFKVTAILSSTFTRILIWSPCQVVEKQSRPLLGESHLRKLNGYEFNLKFFQKFWTFLNHFFTKPLVYNRHWWLFSFTNTSSWSRQVILISICNSQCRGAKTKKLLSNGVMTLEKHWTCPSPTWVQRENAIFKP